MLEINKIYNEDCLVGMQKIDDKSIDMILCDLPYGTTACSWDTIIPFDKLWEQYERIVKDNGAIVLTASQPFTSHLIISNPNLFKYCWVWKKNKPMGFLQANYRPLKEHEDVCIFSKGNATPKANNIMVYNPQGLILTNKKKIRKPGMGIGSDRESQLGEYVSKGTNYPRSILEFDCESSTFHPTQKPVSLFEYLIKTYTNENELILDNCMGSATTAIACLNTNRNFIGFENNQKYFDLATKRIEDHLLKLEAIQ